MTVVLPAKESESTTAMIFGQTARAAGHAIKAIGLTLALFAAPQAASAATVAAPVAAAPAEAVAAPAAAAAPVAAVEKAAPAAAASAVPAVDPNNPRFQVAPGGYTPLKPVEGIGMPVARGLDVQDQFSPIGQQARPLHAALLWLSLVIAVFVLLLLLYVILRFNKRANPVPSKTTHNTLLEVVWTAIPVLILVVVAVPSIRLLADQFKPAPAKALTIKATGNQWYWTYTYPDNGGFEVISNMLQEEKAEANGEPSHLGVDFRMVVPVGEPIRMQVTASDVIHSFAVPSLWFKIDGVPGRIHERVLTVTKPGVYYGQCSELCGARHGYMPIAVEALPRDKYNAWVLTQAGGKIDGLPEAPAAAAAPAAPAAPNSDAAVAATAAVAG
jgi:cytochrome c oxidase subunit 2